MSVRILTDKEREEIISKRPKPKNNIFWENYLNTLADSSYRIGEIITFARYGDFPQDGQSTCHKTLGYPYASKFPKLKGISVFEIVNGYEIYPMHYAALFFERPRITGKGIIVGWGPDGEPLIKIIEIFK